MNKKHVIDAISIFGAVAVLTAAAMFSLVNPSTRVPLYAGSTFSMIASVAVVILGVASIPIVAYLMHLWKIPFNERKIKSMYEVDVPFSDYHSVLEWFSKAYKKSYPYSCKIENIDYDMSVFWRKASDIKLNILAILYRRVMTESDWDKLKQTLRDITEQLQGDFITECPNVRLIIVICVDEESEGFKQAINDVKQRIWKNHYPIGIVFNTKKLFMVGEYSDWGAAWMKTVRRRIIQKFKQQRLN